MADKELQGKILGILQNLRGPTQLKDLVAQLNYDHASDRLNRSDWSDRARTALAGGLEAGIARGQEPGIVVATGAGEKLQIILSRLTSERLLPSLGEWWASPKTWERPFWSRPFASASGHVGIAEF